MADIYYFADNQAKAAESLEQALPIYWEIGDRLGEANALRSLGHVKRAQRAYAKAERFYATASDVYASIDDKYDQGVTLLSLVNVYRSLGDLESARSAARHAKELLAPFPEMVQECERILAELS
jgi:tetratricopeptide (TPR) repeat protein